MASAFKKFKHLENSQAAEQNESVEKPQRKKLQTYNHIVSRFESMDGDVRKRIVQERLKQRQEEKEAKLKEELRRKQEEEERRRKELEEQERIRKLREEEEERKRVEEELKRREEEESARLAAIKKQQEGKYAGLKPAAAMFEKALEAKRSMQRSIKGERVITLRKGTISEIRSKIFDNSPTEEPLVKKAPKKVIIPDKSVKLDPEKSPKQMEEKSKSPQVKVVSTEPRKEEVTNITELDKKDTKDKTDKPPTECNDLKDEKANKRQSFISDFAALEKTYKILGLSIPKEQTTIAEEPKQVKKRHNSEGKVKNKDKNRDKVKRKSVVQDPEPNKSEDPVSSPPSQPAEIETKLNALEKGRAAERKNFFQTLINEKKGMVKQEPELQGPQMRKRASLTQSFGKTKEEENKRKSLIKDDIKVDKKQFNSFLDRFESKDQRAEAKNQILKITKQQKEFEKRKLKQEEEQQKLAEKERAEERLRKEKEEREIQAAIEEEARQLQLKEAEEAELRHQEFEKQQEEERNLKRKVLKKKKKPKPEDEEDPGKDAPKLNIAVNNYKDVKSKFERKKSENKMNESQAPVPSKSLKINKLSNNPFLEQTNTLNTSDDKPVKQGVKVNKLQKNAFMRELEKMGAAPEEKPEPKLKKISSEAHIKFESKKEKVHHGNENNEEINDKKVQVHISKSIEGQNPKKKNSKDRTSSSLSLHKIFIDGPKEFFRSSKEKLYKLSKENLYEVEKPTEPEKTQEQKLSKSEMQNYLLSHVLFDGNDVKKKDKAKKEDDDIDKYLDQEYKDRINQYCTLLEEDKQQQQKKKKKKKKKSEDKKVEEKQPTMKMVDIKSRQQQLFQQQNQPTEKSNIPSVFTKNESKVNKFKEMFDNDNEPQPEERMKRGQENRKSKAKSDIFTKIQALELAEKERLEREKATEERMKKLLQLELERQKEKQTEENELTEDVNEENLKNDILQCLEDEVQNLEQEMLALETEEKLIMEEEAEDNAELKEIEDQQNEMELEEHINQLHEIQNEIEERKKVAANKRKVLERFQHVLDSEKDDNESKSGIKVGSIKDRLANFLDNKESKSVRSFEENESVFVGVSDTMSRFKSKLEAPDEEAPSLFSKGEIKRKPNSTAMKFEMMKFEDEEEGLSVSSRSPVVNKEWNWKKKTAEELHAEVDGPKVKVEEKEPRKSHSFQDTKFNELLADINAVKQRLNERDARWQEKENDRKLLEMEEAIKEVQEVLKSKEEESEESDSDTDYNRRPIRKRKVTKVEDRTLVTQQPVALGSNKIGELKSQLLSMINEDTQEKSLKKENIAVNVSQLKERITQQDDIILPKETVKSSKSQSSGLVLQLAEKLSAPEEKDYDEVPLTKAPKRLLKLDSMFENEEQPAKTLEELKEANQNKKWAWKEKDITEFQDFITAYEDVAPNKLKDQHKKLKDLDEEQKVVESLTKDKDTAILVQIREEKEKEFNNFMNEIHSYLAEGTKDTEEIEFKQGMKGYLELINDDDSSKKRNDIKMPKVKLNTVSKMKTCLFEENDDIPLKKSSSPKVQKLNKEKLEKDFSESDFKKAVRNDITTEGISSVKKLYEKRQEQQEEMRPIEKKRPADSVSIVEKMRRKAVEEKQRRLEHQLKYKLKTVLELHDYIQNHEALANEKISYLSRTFRVSKDAEKLSCHTEFMETLTEYLGMPGQSEEQTIFRCNIQAYLSILNNVASIYNATPKLKKHNGVENFTKSNMRKAILEKSCERPQQVKPIPKQEERILSPEEKKKEILSKYGFKDRSQIVIQELSDDSDSSDSEDEVDIKQMTDKELSEKYGLPYIDVPEENSVEKSDSAVGITNLLSKIRSLHSEKTDVAATKDVFERRRPSDGVVKSDSMARMKRLFDSPTNSGRSSPIPNFETSNHVTMRMKKRFEEAPAERKSWTFDNDEIRKSGSTSRMRQRFENDSPSNSRSSSPLLRSEPGTLMTSKMKKLFEESGAAPKRNSLVGEEGLQTGAASKLKEMFESSRQKRPASPLTRNKGVIRSSTLSSMDSYNQGNDSTSINQKIVENFFSQEKSKPSLMQSPVMKRPSLEKCKSMSKIKDAFEFGKGLNDETEGLQNLQSRKSIHAELELLRSPSNKDISSPRRERKASVDEKRESPTGNSKANLVASFFSPETRARSSSLSADKTKIMREPKDDFLKNERRQINSEIASLSSNGNLQSLLKPSTQSGFNSVQKSSTVSDIGSYLKYKFEDQPAKTLPSPKPNRLNERLINPLSQTQKEDSPKSPLLQRTLEKSRSFSKFKNAFEDGVGIMDSAEAVDADKHRVNAELNALKSSNKIQQMFRINKSKSSPSSESPKLERVDLDEKVMEDVQRSRSNITNMFESLGPKMKFGGGGGGTSKPDKPDPPKPKPSPKKQPEEGELQGRKWVFDTIQKYFDVIVEEGEEEEGEEDEEEEVDEEVNASDSESDYTSADEEIPDILPTPVTEKLPVRTLTSTASPICKQVLGRSTPSYSLPVKRSQAVRANTVSPLCLPKSSVGRKSSVISIDDFVEDAAKQFDQLTDGSDFSIDEDDDNMERNDKNNSKRPTIPHSSSTQSVNQLMKSSSSHKIRGLFNSVVHGSGSSLNVSTFKSNLLAHLKRRDSGNFDPGVGDDSSSEYSEYDD